MRESEQRKRRRRLAQPRCQADEFFDVDLRHILSALTDPDVLHQPLIVNGKNPYNPKRGPRRLPLAPTRRMARLVGVRNLRSIFELAAADGRTFFRLLARPRLDCEFDGQNIYKEAEERFHLIRFGHKVLEARKHHKTKNDAYEFAAASLGMQATKRTYERRYADFRALCVSLQRVPHPAEELGMPPVFDLSDLD